MGEFWKRRILYSSGTAPMTGIGERLSVPTRTREDMVLFIPSDRRLARSGGTFRRQGLSGQHRSSDGNKPDGCDRAGDAFLLANKAGHTLYDYEKALEETSRRYHFPLIDVGRTVNIHRYNEEDYLEDHVHPNRAGYERIGKILLRGIRKCL